MKILAIGLDRTLADPASVSAKRQIAYFRDWDCDMVVLSVGSSSISEIAPNIRVHLSGGSNKLIALMRGYKLAKNLAQQKHVQIVSGQDFLWTGLIAWRVARDVGAKLYVQDHSEFFVSRLKTIQERLFTPIARHIAKRADKIRTVSHRGVMATTKLGVHPKKVIEIPIATDVSAYAALQPAKQEAKTVLCVGRLEWQKGMDTLLIAWHKLIKIFPEARLHIVGTGKLQEALIAQSHVLELSDSVVFRGALPHIRDELEWASIVVQPSRFEGWGMAVIEAAAAAKPIVMTNVGCAGEVIIHDHSGIVIPTNNSEALAKAIGFLFQHPEVATRLGREAQKNALALPTPEQMTQSIRDSFESML